MFLTVIDTLGTFKHKVYKEQNNMSSKPGFKYIDPDVAVKKIVSLVRGPGIQSVLGWRLLDSNKSDLQSICREGIRSLYLHGYKRN